MNKKRRKHLVEALSQRCFLHSQRRLSVYGIVNILIVTKYRQYGMTFFRNSVIGHHSINFYGKCFTSNNNDNDNDNSDNDNNNNNKNKTNNNNNNNNSEALNIKRLS